MNPNDALDGEPDISGPYSTYPERDAKAEKIKRLEKQALMLSRVNEYLAERCRMLERELGVESDAA